MPTEIEIHTKKIIKVRIEFADGTYQELDNVEDCRKWHEMSLSQASNAYVHGMKFPPVPWKHGNITNWDGFIYNGKKCACGHVHVHRYCGRVEGTGEEQTKCICDEPPTE